MVRTLWADVYVDSHAGAEPVMLWCGGTRLLEAVGGMDEILDTGNGFINTDLARYARCPQLGRGTCSNVAQVPLGTLVLNEAAV
eukprot:3034370-Rhodomonas_salina.3